MRRRGLIALQVILIVVAGTLVCFGQTTEKRVLDPTADEDFEPLKQKPITYSDDSIEVTLVQQRVNRGTPRSFVKLRSRATGLVRTVELADRLAQIDEIRRGADSKLIVSGMIGGSGNAIQIFDIANAKAIDEFTCYHPTISSDGKYIAFERYYPPHFIDGTESHYAIYDVTKSPKDNRPPWPPGNIYVGQRIYPRDIGDSEMNVGITGRPVHTYSSGFFWNPDKDEFLFLDRLASDDFPTLDASLVWVQIGPNGKPQTRTVRLPLKKLCSPKRDGWCPTWISEVRFRPHEPRFAVTFDIGESSKTIEYSSSDFH